MLFLLTPIRFVYLRYYILCIKNNPHFESSYVTLPFRLLNLLIMYFYLLIIGYFDELNKYYAKPGKINITCEGQEIRHNHIQKLLLFILDFSYAEKYINTYRRDQFLYHFVIYHDVVVQF